MWRANSSGMYSVASGYRTCESLLGPDRIVSGEVWNNCAPPKVKFFGWLAWLGKLKTSSYLQRIGILDEAANVSCSFCQNEVESVNHILLFCPFVWLLWSQIMKWWGVQWVMPNSVEGLLQWWSFCKMKKLEKVMWKVVPMAVLWSIWKHRNDCIFNGAQPNLEDLCEVVKVRIALWVKSSPAKVEFSINDVVFNLQQVHYCLRQGSWVHYVAVCYMMLSVWLLIWSVVWRMFIC
ncbi:uncharacterized protein LOC114316135 [Camellia sinensis]|uniref:uncharacterized protein LOC114316135 n=1 Tax=Camellia sinensis TaxID=4442 RepID=UPI0010364E63|nr:uncharacterized protein LOC114316135 [Camellia sinensis]